MGFIPQWDTKALSMPHLRTAQSRRHDLKAMLKNLENDPTRLVQGGTERLFVTRDDHVAAFRIEIATLERYIVKNGGTLPA